MMRSDTSKRRQDSPVELWEDLSHELWQVQHGLGEARLMTLDELDAAFKREEINARTLVRKAGTVQWKTLGQIAGIEPSNTTLESESLMPVTSEVDLLAPVIPKPPPLPRRTKDEIKDPQPEALKSADVVLLDVEDVKLELGKKLDASRRADTDDIDREVVLSREELRTARPRSVVSKLFGVALVALVGGGVFAGVSAWLSGAFGAAEPSSAAAPAPPPSPEPTALRAPAAPAPPAPVPTISASEGSVLVLAHAPAAAQEPAPAKPAPAPALAPRTPAASAASRPPNHALAPRNPRAPVAAPHAALPALKGVEAKKGVGAKAPPPQQKAKSR